MGDVVASAGGQELTIEEVLASIDGPDAPLSFPLFAEMLSGRANSALEADLNVRNRAAAAAAAPGRSGSREDVTARLAEKYSSVLTMTRESQLLYAKEMTQRYLVRDLVAKEGVGAPATLAGLRELCSRARGDDEWSRAASLDVAQDVYWLAGGAEEDCATLGLCCPAPSCGKPLTRFRRCGACEFTKYCGPDCSAAHWKTHKPVCKVLRACLPKDYPDSVAN